MWCVKAVSSQIFTNNEVLNVICYFAQEMLYSLQLEEKHELELANLQSSLAISFKEELEQVRYSLHYFHQKCKITLGIFDICFSL